MPFMYLELRWASRSDDWKEGSIFSGGVVCKVVNEGKTTRYLGSENSRLSDTPFAVYQIAGFENLDAIDTRDLWTILFKRHTTEELMGRIGQRFTNKELIQMLQDRLRYPEGGE